MVNPKYRRSVSFIPLISGFLTAKCSQALPAVLYRTFFPYILIPKCAFLPFTKRNNQKCFMASQQFCRFLPSHNAKINNNVLTLVFEALSQFSLIRFRIIRHSLNLIKILFLPHSCAYTSKSSKISMMIPFQDRRLLSTSTAKVIGH